MARRTNVYGLLERVESAHVAVRQERCAMVRNRNARCLKCAEACTSGCIAFTGEELVVSPEKCIGCGTCAAVCPTCALEAQKPSDAELLARCLRAMEACEDHVVVACDRLLEAKAGSVDTRKVVGVPCLGRIDESLVAGLAARGAAGVTLVRGACDTCPYATGLRTAELVCATANRLFEVWGGAMRVQLAGKLPASVRASEGAVFDEGGFYDAVGGIDALSMQVEAPMDSALTTVGDEGPGAAVFEGAGCLGIEAGEHPDAPEAQEKPRPKRTHVMADGTLPHFVPDRHERLLDALCSLGEPVDVELDTRLWGHVTIDVDACESCRMCAVFCPTGALAKYGDAAGEGPFGIEHHPGDCVKCRCCENICPADALTVHDGVRARHLLDGTVERVEMHPVRVVKGGPRSIMNSMRALLGMEEVYER